VFLTLLGVYFMKNFIFKSVLAVSMTLPLLSHAQNSRECGAGTITAIRHNVNPPNSIDRFDHIIMQWDSSHIPSEQWYGGVLIRNPVVANSARVAFLNGTTVRFLSTSGSCHNVDQLIQCQDVASCYSLSIPY
jgi:hypothetical protein